jgi:hypothetical protein
VKKPKRLKDTKHPNEKLEKLFAKNLKSYLPKTSMNHHEFRIFSGTITDRTITKPSEADFPKTS